MSAEGRKPRDPGQAQRSAISVLTALAAVAPVVIAGIVKMFVIRRRFTSTRTIRRTSTSAAVCASTDWDYFVIPRQKLSRLQQPVGAEIGRAENVIAFGPPTERPLRPAERR